MSKVKAGGSTKNNHNSPGQRLGVKRFGGQTGFAARSIGAGTFMSRNYTIHAAKDGVVTFVQRRIKKFTGKTTIRTEIQVR